MPNFSILTENVTETTPKVK